MMPIDLAALIFLHDKLANSVTGVTDFSRKGLFHVFLPPYYNTIMLII